MSAAPGAVSGALGQQPSRRSSHEAERQRYLRCAEPSPCQDSLQLHWAFGLNQDYKSVIHNLSGHDQRLVFYPLAHVGVIYNALDNTQVHLRGHAHTIVASCCNYDRRRIVTVDEGDPKLRRSSAAVVNGEQWDGSELDASAAEHDGQSDVRNSYAAAEDDGSLMIVWDTESGVPLWSTPVGPFGNVLCCAITLDGRYIATVNRRTPQEIMLWDWTTPADGEAVVSAGELPQRRPRCVRRIPTQDEQTHIQFAADHPHLLCTSGLRRVMFWAWEHDLLKYYSPPMLHRKLNSAIGQLTQTVLLPGTDLACSGTVSGHAVLWAVQPKDRVTKPQDKQLLKAVHLHIGGITCVTTCNGYIVTGGMDGRVKFVDARLRLIAWFDQLNGGPIVALSFDRPSGSAEEYVARASESAQRTAALAGEAATAAFRCPDFMVSTAHAMIVDVPSQAFAVGDPELLRGRLLVQGQGGAVCAVAAHPHLARLAIGGRSGAVHLWDYNQRRVLLLSIFHHASIECLGFDPTGAFLVAGFAGGTLKVLDAETLEERQSFTSKHTDSITRLAFSADGRMAATADAGGCVALLQYTRRPHQRGQVAEWALIGRHRTHRGAVCGLQFASNTNGEAFRLLSVGADKRLIEYNLVDSAVEEGLLLRAAHKITQCAVPSGFLWANEDGILDRASTPREALGFHVIEDGEGGGAVPEPARTSLGGSGGDRVLDYLLVATDEFKLSVYLSDWSRQCVKTVLAPTYGGAVREMAILPAGAAGGKCLMYSTGDKVIGLMQLPLRGDPCAAVGLLAHPGFIASTAVSHDGTYVFTAGGDDQSVLQWAVDSACIMPAAADPAASSARTEGSSSSGREAEVPLDHLLTSIEGGPDGPLARDVVDYFYYAQVRAQGEETTARRQLLSAIYFAQVTNVFRALGYYPTELEIGHLTYEVANMYGPRDEPLAEADVGAIPLSFAQFIRLYVNYRPVFGVTREEIEAAFAAVGADSASGLITRSELFHILSTKGEPLRPAEVSAALASLLGDGVQLEMLEDVISARAFAENLLGFEDYDRATDGASRGHSENDEEFDAFGVHELDDEHHSYDDENIRSA